MTDKETEKLARSFWETINDNQADGVLPDLTDEDLRRLYHFMVLLMDEYQEKKESEALK